MGIEQFIESIAVETAVYWGSSTPDGYGGYTYATAVELGVRWENKSELKQARGDDGTIKEIVTQAKIFVTQDVDVGGWIQLCSLTDLDSDPDPVPGAAFEIRVFEKIPMIKKTDEFVRIAYI